MTASESKNQKGHSKTWIWSKKTFFYFLTWLQYPGALMSPDLTVVDATVHPIYEPDMLLNE